MDNRSKWRSIVSPRPTSTWDSVSVCPRGSLFWKSIFVHRPKKRFKCGKHSRFSPGRRKKKHIDQESENDRTFIWWMSSSSATVTSLVIHQIHIFLFRTRTTLTPTRTSLKNT